MKQSKTKSNMISELRKEFYQKQGVKKSKWVTNLLNKLSKKEVTAMYKRLKDKVSYK